MLERLEGRRSALTKVATQSAKAIVSDVSKGTLVLPTSVAEVSLFTYALTGVVATTLPLADLLRALIVCKEIVEAADEGNVLSSVYKAACRIDELFFNN